MSITSGLARLQQWRNTSVNRGIFVAIMTVGLFTLFSKLVSMIKDLFVAHDFGVSSELDAFFVSFIVPSLIINLVGSSFNSSLIPSYVEVKSNEGKEAARELLALVVGRLLLILLGCTVVLAIFGSMIISSVGSKFDAETLQLCKTLYFLLLPSVVVSGVTTIWAAILNAEDEFALAAVVPVIEPIIMIIGLLITPASWGVYSLGVSMLIAFILQSVLLGRSLKKHDLLVMPRFWKKDPALSKVMTQFMPAVMGGVFAYSTSLIDQTMAAQLGTGSVSTLNYGSKLTSFAVGIVSVSISSAVLPFFSKLVAAKDWSGVKRTYRLYGGLILVATGLGTLFVIIFAEPLIHLVFERGAFTAKDTVNVALVQQVGILEIPFFALSILTVRLISALKGNHILAQAAVLNGVVNIIGNYVFIQWMGVAGIALSTSCVYVASFIFLYLSLRRRLRKAEQGAI